MPALGRRFTCPVTREPVKVITLLERTRMGSPVVRTFQSCSGMATCLENPRQAVELCDAPEDCPLRISLE